MFPSFQASEIAVCLYARFLETKPKSSWVFHIEILYAPHHRRKIKQYLRLSCDSPQRIKPSSQLREWIQHMRKLDPHMRLYVLMPDIISIWILDGYEFEDPEHNNRDFSLRNDKFTCHLAPSKDISRWSKCQPQFVNSEKAHRAIQPILTGIYISNFYNGGWWFDVSALKLLVVWQCLLLKLIPILQ